MVEDKRLWCIDEHHGTPCPEPCDACVVEGCEPRRMTTDAARDYFGMEPSWPDTVIAPVAPVVQ